MVGTPTIGQDLNGRIQVFSSDTSGRLWSARETYFQGDWDHFGMMVNGGFGQGNLTAGRNVSGKLEVFDERSGGTVAHAWETSAGGSWSTAGLLPSSARLDLGAHPTAVRPRRSPRGVRAPGGQAHLADPHQRPLAVLGQPLVATPARDDPPGRFPPKVIIPIS